VDVLLPWRSRQSIIMRIRAGLRMNRQFLPPLQEEGQGRIITVSRCQTRRLRNCALPGLFSISVAYAVFFDYRSNHR
jgi:hypothetical protein